MKQIFLKYSLFLILYYLCRVSTTNAQLSFTVSNTGLPNRPFVGYLSKGLIDINKDGYDDIIRTNSKTKELGILINNGSGTFNEVYTKILTKEPISTTVGDINNDGKNDILTGGFYDGIKVFINQNNQGSFLINELNTPLIWMQGANLVDINNDGWLDYFADNDVGLNQIWKNDKSGGLVPVSDWIDMRTVPTSDNSGTYGTVWSDIDNDGDLDLYIAKCSMNAMGPENASDPRRINQLFINHTYERINGQIVKNTKDFSINTIGWFTEEAASTNTKINGQSWTADFADIDNDGDQDLLVTNHEAHTMLLENDGFGHFTDITDASGLQINGEPLQGLMKDFDNDGFVDVFIAGLSEPGVIWRNNGNKTFTKLSSLLGNQIMTSYAIGDVNHDGFYDIYASYYPKVDAEDDLWLNNKNTNHFLAVTLEGSPSNKNGIGAKIIVYRKNNTSIIREVRSGESYGISNSLTQIIGIGQTTEVDKIVVDWPSGKIDTYSTPTIDRYLYLKEGGCMTTDINAACQTTSNCGCLMIQTIVTKSKQ